jgi:hypothetical protein
MALPLPAGACVRQAKRLRRAVPGAMEEIGASCSQAKVLSSFEFFKTKEESQRY